MLTLIDEYSNCVYHLQKKVTWVKPHQLYAIYYLPVEMRAISTYFSAEEKYCEIITAKLKQ